MKSKARTGPKPRGTGDKVRLSVEVYPGEHLQIERNAKRAHLPVATYIRAAALGAV